MDMGHPLPSFGSDAVPAMMRRNQAVEADLSRSRSALPTTDRELNVMAALAMTGERRRPNAGYSAPAATGTPTTL